MHCISIFFSKFAIYPLTHLPTYDRKVFRFYLVMVKYTSNIIYIIIYIILELNFLRLKKLLKTFLS